MQKIVVAIQDFEKIRKGDAISIAYEGQYLYGGYLINSTNLTSDCVRIPKMYCKADRKV